jgi:pyrroline-5-carboxylate reductase
MAETLRVDPERLRAAADAQAEVSAYVASISAGQSMAGAVQAMSGLSSSEACRFAAAVLDGAAKTVSADLTSHAERLSSAADRYRQVDYELGQRLRRIAE